MISPSRSGVVRSGKGIAAGWLAAIPLHHHIGHTLYPGTLNVWLRGRISLGSHTHAVSGGGRTAYLWPVLVHAPGHRPWAAYVVRWSLRTTTPASVEIAARERLRDALALHDGSTVTVIVRRKGADDIRVSGP